MGAGGAAEGSRRSADARTVFEADCAVCHANTARGSGRGPSLAGVGAGFFGATVTGPSSVAAVRTGDGLIVITFVAPIVAPSRFTG